MAFVPHKSIRKIIAKPKEDWTEEIELLSIANKTEHIGTDDLLSTVTGVLIFSNLF